MAFLSAANRSFLRAVSNLLYANPFLPEMVTFERQALRAEMIEEDPLWSASVSDPDRVRANTWLIMKRLSPLVKTLRASLAHGETADEKDLTLYEDGLLYYFYYKHYQQLVQATFHSKARDKDRWAFYRDFGRRVAILYFEIPNVTFPSGSSGSAHIRLLFPDCARVSSHL